ncbi:hypothetical protein [Deinococcus hopiensis]|uniref:DUF4397 domain-containing protein n=1 Tax=Deinococcus hopiensis KR-140 TaxID=695939 RepID=A0A1W1UFD5_9DEIO|nr:hypothetical protein [Deinococcus hopiensis]SMB79743.1 hypothetical protein SAMN00790413_05320 [Deinococcus hopiensis KR-140]
MRNIKTLLTAALFATTLGARAFAAPVYFENDAGASGVVDVYVDGRLAFNDVFADSDMLFPRELTAGAHQITVTPFYLAPGQGDLLSTTVEVTDEGPQTLTFAASTDEFDAPTLALWVSEDHEE